MQRYVLLYGAFVQQRLKILMEYRGNFAIGTVSQLILQTAALTAVWAVMRQIPSLNGWRFDEVLLVYGLLTLARSINRLFADNLWTFGRDYIHTGGFDRLLVRPVNPLFHLLADRFNHDGIGEFVLGALLVGKASVALGIAWTALKLFYLVMAVVSGGIIVMALNLITCVTVFWTLDSFPVTLAVYQTSEFVKYPLSIYGRGISILMTWVIPYGFVSYYPANYLLGRGTVTLAWLVPVVAAALFTLAYRLWVFGLRHYSSTGS